MSKHTYFLGIAGTLMGSLALLAKELGHTVSGSDNATYPPMSDQLATAGIEVFDGFSPDQLNPAPDQIVIGNAGLPRGHEAVEYIIESGLPYWSGAQWLGEVVLRGRWVLAAAGTHGKTTTASMLAWILESANLKPGFLIGGVPQNFNQSARLGDSPFFVVEADEYDTSYFDRRSKFVHYRPRTLMLNNLEFDHADIFNDITQIQTQFHNLLRTVPSEGLVIAPTNDEYLNEVLQMGCWTPTARVGNQPIKKEIAQDSGEIWSTANAASDGKSFDVLLNEQWLGRIEWILVGEHNQLNGLNAIAAALHAGVPPQEAIAALCNFIGVKRRLETVFEDDHLCIYDDFAHHPTAIRTTLQGLRNRVGSEEILAVVEPRTHTMSLGTLQSDLTTCCAAADRVVWFRGENIKWDLTEIVQNSVIPARMIDNHSALVEELVKEHDLSSGKKRHIVIMSNGAFGGIHKTLSDALTK
jgi:UDP-N-acetylmuramate: L-alanyl-gamma-D-glutamyl-meso-diaminopimelate ligase